jgi:hypothetical protein
MDVTEVDKFTFLNAVSKSFIFRFSMFVKSFFLVVLIAGRSPHAAYLPFFIIVSGVSQARHAILSVLKANTLLVTI